MPDDSNAAATVVAITLVAVWSIVTVSLTIEGLDAVAPPHYGLFTAMVFLLLGRLWGIEVDSLLPGSK